MHPRSVLIAVLAFFALPFAHCQTYLDKPLVAELNRAWSSDQQPRDDISMAIVRSSQDPRVIPLSGLGLRISSNGIHATYVLFVGGTRAPMDVISPAATISAGSISGDHYSIPAGTYICFNIKGPCYEGAARSSVSWKAPTRLPDVPPGFLLRGIGLGMTLDDVQKVAKAAGAAKEASPQGIGIWELEFANLSFRLEFNSNGRLRQYNVRLLDPKPDVKDTETSGALYDLLVKSFGPRETWGKGVVYKADEENGTFAIVTDPREL